MKYKTIPYVDKKVSQIFYGTATADFIAGKEENDLLDAVYDMGINTFDLARNYGNAEKSFGLWLDRRQNRDDLVILSKGGHPAPDGEKRLNEREIRKDLAVSTELLHTDYIDIYLLHRDDPEKEAGEFVEILNALHAEGRIGAFGGSNWTHRRLEEANEYAYKHSMVPFTVSSPNFGLADQVADPWGWGCVSISGPENEEARKWYRRENMPIIAYSSLAHGFFSGKLKSSDAARESEILDPVAIRGYSSRENYERLRRCEELARKKDAAVPQIAMAWLLSQDLNTFAVVASLKRERMEQNIAALDISLTEEERNYLDLR